jgi:hypothetical protein
VEQIDFVFDEFCHSGVNDPVVSCIIPITFTHKKGGLTRGVIDTAVTKIGNTKSICSANTDPLGP